MMHKTAYTSINETLYHEQLDNGLNVYILPKEGFNKTYVTLTTPLGSNVTKYQKNEVVKKIPLGIAHFLEHKLFDRHGKDLSEIFSINSARVNAFTTNNRTAYLFSCTEHLNKNIETLMDMVFHPVFTNEGIEKEVGIITQEIKMYEDDPGTLLYMGLLKNMYQNHPVKEDILGTETSIKTINKELLYDVHNTFYSPSEMIMFITGNVNPEDTLNFIKTQIDTNKNDVKFELLDNYNEQNCVIKPSGSIKADILQANCLLGIKLPIFKHTKNANLKQELTFSILFDVLYGKSSDNYQQLLQEGLINESWGTDITLEKSYSFIMIGSNSDYPDKLFKAIRKIISDSFTTTVSEIDFTRTKKQLLGGFINALNSMEYIANQFTKYHFQNTSLFDLLNITKEITLEDVEQCKQYLLDPHCYTEFTVYPK